MHCTCRTLLTGVFASPVTRASALPPAFLLPALAAQSLSFSTTAARPARKCGNPARGVSALRRTGINKKRQRLSVKLADLPEPVLDPAKRSAVLVDEDHGLWDFFYKDRASMPLPGTVSAHGRGWTVPELRVKDWTDLHKLWWTCLKELNRLQTADEERNRAGNMFGAYESDNRKAEIQKTQRAIKHTLTERWYAWQNARNLAMEDEEINLYADIEKGEKLYTPKLSDSNAAGVTGGSSPFAPATQQSTDEVRT